MTLTESVRLYGTPPCRVAVLHGGPGAPGYMAPVARELAKDYGIAEPLQSGATLEAQIEELQHQLTAHCELPATIVGSSWGAVLALLTVAHYPDLARRLIVVGCAAFNRESSTAAGDLRLKRLNEDGRRRYHELLAHLNHAAPADRPRLLKQWAGLLYDADVYDGLTRDLEMLEVQPDIYSAVWADFERVRDQPGYLANLFSTITVPVTVIHGAYDPHAVSGVRPLLERCLKQVEFHILPYCGHYPWIERHARDDFFRHLRIRLSESG